MDPTPTLHFDDRGRGDAVLFVHPFPLDGRSWAHQRDALSADHRVIVPDLRGFGRSTSGTPPRTLDAHADDLAALLDHLGVARATVVGLSMGGYIALAMVRRHAARVARLVLADTRAAADSPEGRATRDASIARVEREGTAALVDGMLPRLLAPGAPAELWARVRAIGASQPPAAVTAALAAMRDRPDATPLLGALAVPTLLLAGQHDAITPAEEMQAMAAAIRGARFVAVPGAGHLSQLEAPEAFDAALGAFLADGASG